MANRTPDSEFRIPNLNRFVRLLLDWFARNARDLPWRRTRDPYAIWVSEIMLQQTQVRTVMPYWERWMRELPTIESAANASSAKIHKLWEGLGYYTRVRNLQKAAQQIAANGRRRGDESQIRIVNQSETPHVVSCKFPEKFEDVLALPGIGRYTAGAICSIAFNQPVPVLDGNVIRVLTRIFGISENPRERETNARLWKLAEELVGRAVPGAPRRGRDTAHCHSHLNQSLMELGALVCTPRNPQCEICPAKTLCVAFKENRIAELPNLGKRASATARRFIALVVEQNGRFLVRRRPDGVVNAHLWEFPNVEMGARLSEPQHERLRNVNGEILATYAIRTRCESEDPRSDVVLGAATRILGFTPQALLRLCTIKHSITRYRITLDAYRANPGGTSCASSSSKTTKSGTHITRPSAIGVWKTRAQMRQLAFTSAHKKILNRLS